jgi:hypothetical protein
MVGIEIKDSEYPCLKTNAIWHNRQLCLFGLERTSEWINASPPQTKLHDVVCKLRDGNLLVILRWTDSRWRVV